MQGIRDQIFLKTTRVAGSGASGREAPFLMHLRITCCKGQPPLLSWHSFSIVREVGNGFDHQFVIPINQILKGDAGLDAINLAAYSEQM